MSVVEKTLEERKAKYGDFTDDAHVAQQIKLLMHTHEGWTRMSFVQREALELIATKLGRLFTGDPNYADNWHDIAGYATLAEQRCQKSMTNEQKAVRALLESE
jgi:hypothetical protein